MSDSLVRIFVRNFIQLLSKFIFDYNPVFVHIDHIFSDCVGPTALVATMVNDVEVFVRLVYRLGLFNVQYSVKRQFYDFSSEKGKNE